jgi:N6-L-threonylcarbamoyladenine synthase
VEKLAMEGWSEHRIPLSMDKVGIVCHLSGAETQVQRWLKFGTLSHEDIAAEVFDFLARTVSRMALMAEKHTGIHQILIAGGVASSSLLRDMVRNRVSRQSDLTVYFGKNELSGDNAVGVALIGREKFLAERQGEHDVGSNS